MPTITHLKAIFVNEARKTQIYLRLGHNSLDSLLIEIFENEAELLPHEKNPAFGCLQGIEP
jgi:hypothetical protein